MAPDKHINRRSLVFTLLLLHLIHASIRINFHGKEIIESINKHRILPELLGEGIRKVVSRIGTDEEDTLTNLGELDGEGATAGGLTDTTFATNEDPFESLLVENVLETRIH